MIPIVMSTIFVVCWEPCSINDQDKSEKRGRSVEIGYSFGEAFLDRVHPLFGFDGAARPVTHLRIKKAEPSREQGHRERNHQQERPGLGKPPETVAAGKRASGRNLDKDRDR